MFCFCFPCFSFFNRFLSRESLSLIFLVPQKFTKTASTVLASRQERKSKNQFLWSRNIAHPSASPQISPYLSSLALFCPLSSLLPSSFSRFWLLAPSQRGGTESQGDGKGWWRRLEGCWCKKQIVPERSTQTHTVFFLLLLLLSHPPPPTTHRHTHRTHALLTHAHTFADYRLFALWRLGHSVCERSAAVTFAPRLSAPPPVNNGTERPWTLEGTLNGGKGCVYALTARYKLCNNWKY